MADLRLMIKALFEGSEEIDKAKQDIESLGESAVKTKDTGSDAMNELQTNTDTSMLGIYAAIEIGKSAYEALEFLYENTVGKTLEIAGEVEELVRISGDAPEDMGSLRQFAQDAGVDFDDLYKAMENLNKNGIPPTIENIAEIADEYIKLEDPIAKAKLLTENFGEAGSEIAPMLEDITGGVDSIRNAGPVFTEEDLQAARDHEAAIAGLKSSWEEFAITIGQKAIPALTALFNQISDSSSISELREQLNGVAKEAYNAGKITEDEYNAIIKEAYNRTKTTGEATDYLATTIGYLNGELGITTSSAEDATGATKEMSDAEKELADAAMAAALEQAKLIAELDNVTSLEGNYKGIIDLAFEYTDILDEIADIQEQMKDPDLGAEEYTELEGKLEGLKGTMTELANQVTLDMFQATIAVGGVTEAELAAYFQMAIDMGLISEEGAQAAMDAYGSAIETINGYKIDDKTGNVIIDAAEAYATLVMIQQMQIADKTGNIDIFVKYHGTTPSGGYDPYENYTGPGGAVGMAVQGGNPYTWQEYGYKGELFVPSSDGYILSRADAERALSKALTTGGDGMDAEAIGKAVEKAIANVVSGKSGGGNVYNLTMPTSSNPADVRTAFELMEAWGA